jgi:hypothetical protein
MAMPAWVSEVGVAGTWLIAAIALFGEKMRSMLFTPQLELTLVSDRGELTTQLATVVAGEKAALSTLVPVRYYHVFVRNKSHYPVARDVRVFLTQVDKRGPDGKPQPVFVGSEIPLPWKYQEPDEKTRAIGRVTVAAVDLFFVRNGSLQLALMFYPNNLLYTMSGESHIWITVVARAPDTQSKPLRLRIDWDGHWERGEAEMAHHLRIVVEK